MYISRACYYRCCHLCVPGLHLLLPPIWFCQQKFKTTACTSLLPFLNSVAAALPLAAATRQLQRGCCNAAAATRMLQRGCCNVAAASSAASRSGLMIKLVAALLITCTYRPVRSNTVFHRAHYCLLET